MNIEKTVNPKQIAEKEKAAAGMQSLETEKTEINAGSAEVEKTEVSAGSAEVEKIEVRAGSAEVEKIEVSAGSAEAEKIIVSAKSGETMQTEDIIPSGNIMQSDKIRKSGKTIRYGNMELKSSLPLLTFPSLTATGMVKHGFTTRAGGVSEGIFSTLNLSFSRGDREEAVRENFRRTAAALEVEEDSYVFTDQTHTVNVLRVRGEDAGKGWNRERGWSDIDGLITNEPGLTLSGFFADCVPLFFVDPVNRAIGLSHSGWRGTVNRMGRVTVEAMKKEFGTDPADLICGVGPCICGSCYEIGPEVAEPFSEGFGSRAEEFLRDDHNGKFHLDLKAVNRIILEEAGVRPEHITDSGVCTCCEPEILFSHRASRGRRGNLGAFLALNPPRD